jgi:HK97 family phage prohead protease
LDADVLPVPESEEEHIAEDDEEKEPELPRDVDPKAAKKQIKEKLAAESKGFDFSLLKEKKTPANDNFKQTVLWPLMDQLKRSTFEPVEERRTKSIISARYLRELIDIVEADSLGSSVHLPGKDTSTEHDIQRTESGSVYFEHGQTYDRRKVTINNEDRDVRFIGSVRTAKKSLPVGGGGFNSNHDSYGDTVAKGAFKKTISDAKAGVGPWPAMLSQHGFQDETPIGIWTGLDEEDRGLKMKGKLALNVKRGAEAYALLKMQPRPALNGLSIGYVAKDYEIHRSGPVKRTLKAIDLVECSLVTFPADKFARVASVKSGFGGDPVDDSVLANRWAANEFEGLRRLMNRNGR